mgnify:CR=1 FL=1
MKWYVVNTRPREEARAVEHLTREGYQCLYPRIRRTLRTTKGLVDRVDSLFPNYLFLHANPMTDNLARVRSTRGVRNLVRFGLEPAEVPPEVIDELQVRADKQSGVIKLTGQTRQEVAAKFSEGAFVDFGGVFLTSDGSERVILLMRVLGDYNKVNLPEEQLDGRQVAA